MIRTLEAVALLVLQGEEACRGCLAGSPVQERVLIFEVASAVSPGAVVAVRALLFRAAFFALFLVAVPRRAIPSVSGRVL